MHFSKNFAELLTKPVLNNICEELLLKIGNISFLYWFLSLETVSLTISQNSQTKS